MSALPTPTRRAAVVLAVASAAAVIGLGLAVENAWAPLLPLDAALEESVHGWAVVTPWAVDVSRFLEAIGRFAIAFWFALAAVLVLVARHRRRLALGVALIAAIAPFLTDQIKLVVGRARPVWEDPLAAEPTYSFPSGHATAGIAVYAVAGIALAALVRDGRWGWTVAAAATLLGIAIGLSRIVLGLHWPSDVVGGWCVALAVAGVVTAFLLPRRTPD